MKKVFFLLILLAMAPLATYAQSSEADAVKAVVNKAYVEAIHNGGPIADIKEGFHPSFAMLRLVDNEVKPLSLNDWIAGIESSRAKNPEKGSKSEAKYISVDVTGNVATVKLELYKESKHLFTDYLTMMKFNEGWRIVSKAYFRH